MRRLELEISTKCTIKCPACPRTYQKPRSEWNTGFLNKDLITKAISGGQYDVVTMCGAYGDAIYHPDFIEIMRNVCQVRQKIIVETNGAHRDKNFWQQIADLPWGPKKVFLFSIDGLEDTNHIYRKNSNWDSIITAVKTLRAASPRPHVVWRMLVFPYNEHQVDEARELSKELGFDAFRVQKSLRNYKKSWFENDEERRAIDWNYS